MADKVYVTVGVDGRNVPSGGESGQLLSKATDADYDFAWVSPGSGGGGTGGSPAETKSPKDTGTGRLGISEDYARQDHAHPINVPTTGLPIKDGTAAIGDSDYYAPFNHIHPLNVDSTTPSPIGTAAVGTSTSYARRDHVHAASASNVTSTNGNVQTDINKLTLNVISISLPKASWVDIPSVTANVTSSTITAATVTTATFITAVSSITGRYEFSYSSSAWELNSNTVDLATYGISITGTAADGDIIVVTYVVEQFSQTVTVSSGTSKTLVDLRPDKDVIKQMTEDGTIALYVANSSGTFTAYAVGDKPTVDLTVSATRVESA